MRTPLKNTVFVINRVGHPDLEQAVEIRALAGHDWISLKSITDPPLDLGKSIAWINPARQIQITTDIHPGRHHSIVGFADGLRQSGALVLINRHFSTLPALAYLHEPMPQNAQIANHHVFWYLGLAFALRCWKEIQLKLMANPDPIARWNHLMYSEDLTWHLG